MGLVPLVWNRYGLTLGSATPRCDARQKRPQPCRMKPGTPRKCPSHKQSAKSAYPAYA